MSDCLAKTYFNENGRKCEGRSVLDHCSIVGAVARALIARLPTWLRKELYPHGSHRVASDHDVGKVSPTFQEKIHRGVDGYSSNSLPGLENINPVLENLWGGHGGVSQVAVQAYGAGKYIPEIVGQHHGYSPDLTGRLALDEAFGGSLWQAQREQLIFQLKEKFGDWPKVTSAVQARVISGLTTVADWIGSGPLFEDPSKPWEPYIEQALDLAGFVQPKLQKGLSFEDIFSFQIRETQNTLIHSCTQPGVYILEAPMGLGKTEAALYAAYRAMSDYKATGIYFALPTQLTSDMIHLRVNEFLKKILEPACIHHQALLLHGNAWLKQTEIGEEGRPGGSWFQSRKRGILAPFAVGTIDQALMAVMNVKHGFVRTFGLAGKVIILDEVHSYDAYTGSILDRLVKDLRDLQCTVIILSATLTSKRREALLEQLPKNNSYPLISVLQKDKPLQELETETMVDATVAIEFCNQNKQALNEALRRAEQGQQVLWIENTVDEAQTMYKMLAEKCTQKNISCGLLHSRFLKCDRENNEKEWVSILGKNGKVKRQVQGRILIGTQVLEQSLDIDADFLVSRICPTDMLLQRLGRLWRHKETLRPEFSIHEAWILTPSLSSAKDNPKKAFGKTALVYSPYVLFRSLEVWNELQSVELPSQIRSLTEATYSDRTEIDSMFTYQAELEQKRKKLEQLALVGLSHGGKTLPESKASTRYSEQDSAEVLLLQSYRHDDSDRGTWVTLLNGSELYLPRISKSLKNQQWRNLSASLIQNTVRVADYLAPTEVSISDISWLENYLYLGKKEHEESLLRVAVVQNCGLLKGLDNQSASATQRLNYDSVLGYQAKKI